MTHARIGKKIPPSFSMDLELPIAAGITAVYGPAGSGKTLLLELLAGFATPDSGRILLNDLLLFDAAARVNVAPHRRRCGYVSQRDSLFPHLTLRQNLAFAAQHFARLERHRRIADMLERFQLTEAAATLPRDLSPDLRLRGAVGRMLLAEPRLILLDERTWSESMLAGIRAAASVPILMVSGDLDLCCAAADTLVILDRGRIVQQGTPRAVLDAPDSIEAARLLGIPNLFEAGIGALDPGRNTSRLEFDGFVLTGPYIPGHFRGDRVWVAVYPGDLRVHPGDFQPPPNSIRAALVKVSKRSQSVRLEFEKGIFADLPLAEYARAKDNRSWQVEFPPEALKIL
jgi:molybdate transport system ATP-binding protein